MSDPMSVSRMTGMRLDTMRVCHTQSALLQAPKRFAKCPKNTRCPSRSIVRISRRGRGGDNKSKRLKQILAGIWAYSQRQNPDQTRDLRKSPTKGTFPDYFHEKYYGK